MCGINKKNAEGIIKNLYQEFKSDFINGDVIITGSFLYEKMGLISSKEIYKDIDISIITGETGNELVKEIQMFYLKQGVMSKLNKKELGLRGIIMLPETNIDIFREDFNKYVGVDFELISGVWMKNYGVEKIIDGLNLLIDDLNKKTTTWSVKKIERVENTIKEIKENS